MCVGPGCCSVIGGLSIRCSLDWIPLPLDSQPVHGRTTDRQTAQGDDRQRGGSEVNRSQEVDTVPRKWIQLTGSGSRSQKVNPVHRKWIPFTGSGSRSQEVDPVHREWISFTGSYCCTGAVQAELKDIRISARAARQNPGNLRVRGADDVPDRRPEQRTRGDRAAAVLLGQR